MTKTQQEQYLRDGGVKCPYCESMDIVVYAAGESEEGIKTEPVRCDNCQREWVDVYRLSSVKDHV